MRLMQGFVCQNSRLVQYPFRYILIIKISRLGTSKLQSIVYVPFMSFVQKPGQAYSPALEGGRRVARDIVPKVHIESETIFTCFLKPIRQT